MKESQIDRELDKPVRINGIVTTTRIWLNSQEGKIIFEETDAMILWNRKRFNSMSYDEQQEYDKKLKEKRLYWVNKISVPKIVYEFAKSVNGEV